MTSCTDPSRVEAMDCEEASPLPTVYEPRPCALGLLAGLFLFGFAAVVCVAGVFSAPTSAITASVEAAGRRLAQDEFGTEVIGTQVKQASSQLALSRGLQVIIAIAFACIYKQRVVDHVHPLTQHKPSAGQDDFDIGLFSCLHDFNYCLMVMFCAEVRQAHTNEAAGVCGFWSSLALLLFGSVCLAPCCGPCCINVYFRMHLKDMLGIEDHCINDYIIAHFCWHCAVGQQALAIDQELGYSVNCCCNKVSHSRQPLSRHDHDHQKHHQHHDGA